MTKQKIKRILFRCDATAETGVGHLSRCLALAEALRRSGKTCHFIGHWSGLSVKMLQHASFTSQPSTAATGSEADAESIIVASEQGAVGVLIDSYQFDVRWLKQLSERGVKIVLIDDFASLGNYESCLGVINFTVEAPKLNYPGLSGPRVARGPRYFPVREKLINLRKRKHHSASEKPKRALITMGGGDPKKMTLPVYNALKTLMPELQLRALVKNGAAIAKVAGLNPEDFPDQSCDLAKHYLWADCCVSGGGLTKYECGYLGLPVAIFSQTQEQQMETDAFCSEKLGWDLTPLSKKKRWKERLELFVNDKNMNKNAQLASRRVFSENSSDRAASMVWRLFTSKDLPSVQPRIK